MTLQNDFDTLITEMEDNLQAMGVLDAEFDSSTGLRGLSARILDIEPSVSGLNLETSLTIQSETEIEAGESIVISSKLNVSYDDLSGVLTGATINIKEGNNIIGTGITNSNGVADISISNLSLGEHILKAVFTGTENFQECESNTISINVITLDPTSININATKNILSYADSTRENPQIATLTATVNPISSGRTVQIFKDDVLVATEQTDSQGQVSYEYTSQGVGDVEFEFKCESVSENFSIRDVTKYYPNEAAIISDLTARTDVAGRTIYKKALPFTSSSNFTLEFKVKSWGYPSSSSDISMVVGIDLISMSDYTVRCAMLTYNNRVASYFSMNSNFRNLTGYTTPINTDAVYKIVVTNGNNATWYKDGVPFYEYTIEKSATSYLRYDVFNSNSSHLDYLIIDYDIPLAPI